MTLAGRTVLVPRGGSWGARVCDLLAERGATGWVVPLVAARPLHTPQVRDAVGRLTAGDYDWLVVTSAATVGVLESAAEVRARVAAVGPATAAALEGAGFAVDLVPEADFSAEGLLRAWGLAGIEAATSGPAGTGSPSRVLVLHSDLARDTLADGLSARGHRVDTVIGYRVQELAVPEDDIAGLAAGRADAVLVTSGSVARSLARFAMPTTTTIACLGPVTARDAAAVGLRADVVAPERTVDALIGALEDVS
ncbi:uroporphyrinogen-III synthase [Occultella glacieicola]|uniref:Uroporphyrinogen-III synthase n=1 Tax=Occultella glacieicola TaxID=2518684 RepID=A0ABY2E5U9_9MICO|nr:uroporphyrinogen-III synthase [Occultella glacieicola]TDE95839.1 uroporphyrinogen-III synthase [Occultella glacieicola]